jgi:hypothetical protein
MLKGIVAVALVSSCSVAFAKAKTSKPKAATPASGNPTCLIAAQQAADAICRINDCKEVQMVFEGMEAGAEKYADEQGHMNIRAVAGNGETLCTITRLTYGAK